MSYQHHYTDGTPIHYPLGKVVCIGRNYAEHAKELNNPVPTEPLLFIKAGSCTVPLEGGFSIPSDRGAVHYEAEIAVLIGKPLSRKPNEEEVRDAISGFAPALDLTLRDVQARLKEKGHPWEIAKSFDGACVLAPFVPGDAVEDLGDIGIRLSHQRRSPPGRQQQPDAQCHPAAAAAHCRAFQSAAGRRGADRHAGRCRPAQAGRPAGAGAGRAVAFRKPRDLTCTRRGKPAASAASLRTALVL